MSIGIYSIEAISQNRWFGGKYIGQSKNIEKRFEEHKILLKSGRHHNYKLQYYYNKYGISLLRFNIIYIYKKETLDFWEKWFIYILNTFNNKYNFNLTKGGDSGGRRMVICELQNIDTGKIEKCDSITEFSYKHNVNRSNISMLFKGHRKIVDNWTLLKTYKQLKKIKVIDPNGREITVIRISQFVKKYKIRRGHFYQMIKGERKTCQGWHLPHIQTRFRFIHNSGDIEITDNFRELGIKIGIDSRKFSYLVKNVDKSYKGWRYVKDN